MRVITNEEMKNEESDKEHEVIRYMRSRVQEIMEISNVWMIVKDG